jgi:hypothetical protein
MTRTYSGARQLHDQGTGDIVRNTVGLPVRNGIASFKSPNGINEAKNAVGAPKANTARDTSTITVGRTVRNAVGAQVPSAAGGLSIGAQQGVDPRALRGTTPRVGIDGTAVGHRNTSSIGGPARNPAGAINGTIVHR